MFIYNYEVIFYIMEKNKILLRGTFIKLLFISILIIILTAFIYFIEYIVMLMIPLIAFATLGIGVFTTYFLFINKNNISKDYIETNTNDDVNINIANDDIDLDTIDLINKLPIELLGKIKFIENELLLLKRINVSDEVLSLINECVTQTTSLLKLEKDKLIENNTINEHIINKLNNYLDNTIEYIHSLRANKEIEERYIKEQLAETIYDAIDKNTEIFKFMAKDNHLLTKYLK